MLSFIVATGLHEFLARITRIKLQFSRVKQFV